MQISIKYSIILSLSPSNKRKSSYSVNSTWISVSVLPVNYQMARNSCEWNLDIEWAEFNSIWAETMAKQNKEHISVFLFTAAPSNSLCGLSFSLLQWNYSRIFSVCSDYASIPVNFMHNHVITELKRSSSLLLILITITTPLLSLLPHFGIALGWEFRMTENMLGFSLFSSSHCFRPFLTEM